MSTNESTSVHESVRTLLTGVVDYAGLFPPSKLEMGTAVNNYAKYLRSEHAWMLGRLVCPVPRLHELTERGAIVMPGTHATSGYMEQVGDIDTWRISSVITGPLDEQLETIYAFNKHHDDQANGLAMVDAIEMRVSSAQEIDDALEIIPEMIGAAFEIPQDIVMNGDPRGLIAALAGSGTLAKIRCGGVEPSMFPSSEQIARFIIACRNADVAFKCTAGLHHPIRAEHALTYEDDAPKGVMHGFLNVFLASAIARINKDADEALLVEILNETDASAFEFGPHTAAWRNHKVDEPALANARDSFVTSFGSCSFTEPIDDLRSLGQL